MNSKSLVTAVCNAVSKVAGVTVTPEFPDRQQDLPLRTPIISVGVKDITAEGIEGVKLAEGAAPSTVTVRLTVCVPKLMTGEKCMQTIDAVINSLRSILQTNSILSIKVNYTRYSAKLSALVTDIDVKFNSGNAF